MMKRSALSFALTLSIVASLLGGAIAAADEPTLEHTIRIEAYVDGRSQLILRGDTAQWHHLDYSAPGRELFVDEPTIINGVEWYPTWPDVPDAENRFCDCLSDVLTGVEPPLPEVEFEVRLRLIESRFETSVVQQPTAANGYTTIVEFNDNPPGGSAWYIVEFDVPVRLLSGFVDASRDLGPKWTRTLLTPIVCGDYTFILDWEGDANLRMSVKERKTGRWIGENITTDQPKNVTVRLRAGVGYKIAVWAKQGSADFSVTMIRPVGDRIFASTVDADRIVAPKWTRTIHTPCVTGKHQFVLDWEGDANLRISVKDHATGKRIGKNVTTDHPKNVTVYLEAGVEYKIAVWAKHGSGDFTLTAYAPPG